MKPLINVNDEYRSRKLKNSRSPEMVSSVCMSVPVCMDFYLYAGYRAHLLTLRNYFQVDMSLGHEKKKFLNIYFLPYCHFLIYLLCTTSRFSFSNYWSKLFTLECDIWGLEDHMIFENLCFYGWRVYFPFFSHSFIWLLKYPWYVIYQVEGGIQRRREVWRGREKYRDMQRGVEMREMHKDIHIGVKWGIEIHREKERCIDRWRDA